MKMLKFIGNSDDDLREFPDNARQEAGYQLHKVQMGEEPSDWKPLKTIGSGVNEIRIKEDNGEFRVIYVAKFKNAIYVLHCFQKKTQKTEKKDIDLAKARFNYLIKEL